MDNQGSVEVNYVPSAGCMASDPSCSGLFLTSVCIGLPRLQVLTPGQSSEVATSLFPGVPPCRLPSAGDLSGLPAGYCSAQRHPGLPSPRPSAGEMRMGLGLREGEAPGVMWGLRGHCPSGHIKEEMGYYFCWGLLPDKGEEES